MGGGGASWALAVIGEPGIGKSRLLAELGHRAEQRGCLVFNGRAAEFERDVPFGLLLDALNDYLGSLEPGLLRALGDETLAELALIFPALARFGSVDTTAGLTAERYRAHYAIRSLLERLAARQPVVLLLDDVHWIDEASIEAVAHLLRRLRGPLLVVIAARGPVDPLTTAFELMERRGSATRLKLAPLTKEEADELVGAAHDAATRAGLYRESGGNPFYLEELARAAAAGDRAPAAPRSTLDLGDVVLPWAVGAEITAEVARLPEDVRQVLNAAAIAGESFEPELLAELALSSPRAVMDGLDQLLGAGLVRPTAAPRVFRFRHPIVRRAVYELTPGGWQLAAHARAAAALSKAGAAPAACAHHVERSAAPGDESSVSLLLDAARGVAARAPATAGRWLQAALRLLPAGESADRRLSLLTEAAGVLAQAGAFEESLQALERALALVATDRPRDRAALVVQIAAAKRKTGHPIESRTLLERASCDLGAADQTGALALRGELVIDHFYRGEFAPMARLAAALRDDAGSEGEELMESLAGALVSIACSSLGQSGDARDELARAQARFQALSDERLASGIELCGWLGLAALRVEHAGEALEHVRRVAETATDAATLSGNHDLVIVAVRRRRWPASGAASSGTRSSARGWRSPARSVSATVTSRRWRS